MEHTYLDCLAYLGVGGAHPGGLQLTKKMLARENIDNKKSILDAGCGTGQTSEYIAKSYECHVASLDVNEIMVEKANQRFILQNLQMKAEQGATENLPFEDASFDIVLSESVIAFTTIALSIPEFKRVLKLDGLLITIEMVLEKPLSEEESEQISYFYGVSRLLTEAEWINAFKGAGFTDIRVENMKQQFDKNDVENAPDFSLSENMDDIYFEMWEDHEHFINDYKEKLGFRVFRCYV